MQFAIRYFKVHFGGPVFIIAQVEFSRFVAKTCFVLMFTGFKLSIHDRVFISVPK